MMDGLLLTVVLCTVSPQSGEAAAQADPKLVRVYVSTTPAGSAEDSAARRESVAQLKVVFGAKKKEVVVAEDEEKADVAIDVVGREMSTPKIVIGLGPRPGQPTTQSPSRLVHLRVELEAPRLETTLQFENKTRIYDTGPGWKSAADDVAKQILKWIADNRTRILEKR
jgi:hypothetical protein